MAKSVGGSFAAVQAPASVVPGQLRVRLGQGRQRRRLRRRRRYPALSATWRHTTTADAKGTFTFLVTPAAKTSYSVVWVRSGDSATDLASASVSDRLRQVGVAAPR